MNKKNRISIITVSYNAEKEILPTINSVLDQTYTDIEYIIIDGKSTDKTLMVVQDKSGHYKNFKLLSEPDQGIYDAMNKGAEMASGEWVIFMNAGDTFYRRNTLERLIEHLSSLSIKPDIIYGDYVVHYKDGLIVETRARSMRKILLGMMTTHQSMMCRTELLKKHPFNIKYDLAADFDFLMKNKIENSVISYINLSISVILSDGKSDIERYRVLKQYKQICLQHTTSYLLKIRININFLLSILSVFVKELTKRILPKKIISIMRRLNA